MDATTAMLLWATEALTLAILLVAAWLQDRNQVVMGLWGAGFAGHGLGIALVGLRGVVPDLLSIIGGNLTMLIGITCWLIGVLRYDNRPVRPWHLIPVALFPVLVTLPFVLPFFWARVVTFQSLAAATYVMLAHQLYFGQKPASLLRKVFSLVLIVQAGLMFNMGLQALLRRPSYFFDMPNLTFYSVGNIFCLVAAILLGARMLMARSEERLRQIALTDPLTGVLNRRGLLEQFQKLQGSSSVRGQNLALIIFDLDSFKQINDRHGHATGDRVLNTFCAVAQTCLAARGQFGRMGGEEFACILSISSAAEAVGLAEAIRIVLAGTEIENEQGMLLKASVSAGISISGGSQLVDLDNILSRADKALYLAKNTGRNRTALNDGANITIVPSDDRNDHPIQPRTILQNETLPRLTASN